MQCSSGGIRALVTVSYISDRAGKVLLVATASQLCPCADRGGSLKAVAHWWKDFCHVEAPYVASCLPGDENPACVWPPDMGLADPRLATLCALICGGCQ